MGHIVLVAKRRETLYFSQHLVTLAKNCWIEGDILLSEVLGIDAARTSTTASDPNGYVLRIQKGHREGWIRLARLCPGEDYEKLREKFQPLGYELPKGKEDWPMVGKINLCEPIKMKTSVV